MTAEYLEIIVGAVVAVLLGSGWAKSHLRGRRLGQELEEVRSIPPKAPEGCGQCLERLQKLEVDLEKQLARLRDTVTPLAKLGGVKLPAPELPDEAEGD